MRVIATTDKMVVIDLGKSETIALDCSFMAGGIYLTPRILRVYKDRIELDVECWGKKKTFKFWLHDLLIMNRALYRIMHPAVEKK